MDLRACEPSSAGHINRRILRTFPDAGRNHPLGRAACYPVSRPVREGQTTFRSGKRLESCPGEAVSSKWALCDPFSRTLAGYDSIEF